MKIKTVYGKMVIHYMKLCLNLINVGSSVNILYLGIE